MEEISNRFDNLRVPVSANEREKGTTPYYGANGIQDYVKGFTHNGEYVLIAEDGANDLKNYPVKYVNGLFWANNHVHVVQGKEGICDNKYLKYCFTKTNIESLLVGGGRAKLNANIMMGIELTVPSFNEQVELGRMFYELDNLITLHQRKYDNLVKVKKSLLEKMFPKNSSNVPEIRFKGFVDAWEQRKFSDYVEVSDEKNSNDIYNKTDVLSVSGELGIVNQIELQGRSFAGSSVSNYGVVNTGDIVYTKSPLKVNPYGIIKSNKGKTGIVSTLYAIYRPKNITNPFFVQTYFEQNARVNNYLHPLVNKGAKNDMKVSDSNALLGNVIFPKKTEQDKIYELFTNLGNLITLHQHKELKRRKDKNGHLRW